MHFNFFFDNDQDQLDAVMNMPDNTYTCIKVAEDPIAVPRLERNSYSAHATLRDATAGLTTQHFKYLLDKLQGKAAATPAHVVFDWDNTLSVVNGLYMPKESYAAEDIRIEDVVEYLMGGGGRLQMLRTYFKELREIPGVTVSILTNNSSISKNAGNKPEFLKLAQAVIGPDFPAVELIAAIDYPNKGEALRRYKSGGGRTRKRRRRRAKSRQARKSFRAPLERVRPFI